MNGAHWPAWRTLVASSAESAGSARAIALRLGVTEAAVSRWLSGEREPTAKMQARIVELLSARPESAPEVPACRTDPKSVARQGIGGRDRFVTIVERLEAEIAACGANVPRNHVSALYAQLQGAVEKLSKFDGDGELTVNQLLRSRAWAEVEGVLLEVLRRHPGAAEDLLGALDALRER